MKDWFMHYLNRTILIIINHHQFEAIAYYDKAIAIRPNYATALNNKGLALNDLGKYSNAIAYYDKSLAIRPNDSATLDNKGFALNF